jgi:HEAT repeat protein
MNPQSEKFLKEIQNDNADMRYAAWTRTGEMDPEVIPELAKLLTTAPPGVRRAAEEALKNMVHSVGKDPAAPKRSPVVRQFIALTAEGHSAWVRTIALRHLSLIGGDETVPAAAKLLRNTELQEEAVFCLERTPGKAATQALMTALSEVSDAFKPRVLAALGHRGADEAADLCAKAMASSNVEVSLAGMKALARIGRRPSGELHAPDEKSLSDWQKTEFYDSILRYAEAQVARGNAAEAVRIYKEEILQRPEEHLQCAAVIGLGKANTAEAAALIFTKLHSPNHTVRITAGKVWAAMAKNS